MQSDDFRRQKWQLVLRILGIGMGVALVWSFWTSHVFQMGYPESYVLGAPGNRFGDFTNETLAASLPNPYADPLSIYPPAAFLFLRALPFSDNVNLIAIDFLSVIAFALLLFRALSPIIPDAWTRVSLSFFFLAVSYPLLFCIDLGNTEILVVPFIGWAIYFYSRGSDFKGTACLFPVACMKLFPALFLFLLLRRRKTGLALACGIGALAVNAACFYLYPAPASELWSSYRADARFFTDYYFLDNNYLCGAASFWNAYKIILISLHKIGVIPSISFGFDAPFIVASYHVYLAGFGCFLLLCMGYAALYERTFGRAALMLLLPISIYLPHGPEYRLGYASMAIILLVLQRSRRPGDLTALVLLALAVIPKKEIFLTYAGRSDTGFCDVSIQALLNPIFILAAAAILFYDAFRPLDWRRAAFRLRNLLPRAAGIPAAKP